MYACIGLWRIFPKRYISWFPWVNYFSPSCGPLGCMSIMREIFVWTIWNVLNSHRGLDRGEKKKEKKNQPGWIIPIVNLVTFFSGKKIAFFLKFDPTPSIGPIKAKFKEGIGGWIDDRQSYKGLKTFHGFLREDFCVFMHTNTKSYIYIYIYIFTRVCIYFVLTYWTHLSLSSSV